MRLRKPSPAMLVALLALFRPLSGPFHPVHDAHIDVASPHARDREAAEREARLLALTIRLARLTWALLAVTVGTLAVAIVTLALN